MKHKFKEFLKYGAIMSFVIFIRLFVIDVISVQGCSMQPTLNETNDKVILEKYKQFTNDYNYGDIVVVKEEEVINKRIIKRIIGLPNDVVEILNGSVYVNGEIIEESYLSENTQTYPNMINVVPSDSVFILGDNRENSRDSRSIGTVKIDTILGKGVYRFNFKEILFDKL